MKSPHQSSSNYGNMENIVGREKEESESERRTRKEEELSQVVNIISSTSQQEKNQSIDDNGDELNNNSDKSPTQWVEIEAIVTKSRFVGEVAFDSRVVLSSRNKESTIITESQDSP